MEYDQPRVPNRRLSRNLQVEFYSVQLRGYVHKLLSEADSKCSDLSSCVTPGVPATFLGIVLQINLQISTSDRK